MLDFESERGVPFAEEHGKSAIEPKLREALGRISTASGAMKQRFVQSFRTFAAALGIDAEQTNVIGLVKEILGSDVLDGH